MRARPHHLIDIVCRYGAETQFLPHAYGPAVPSVAERVIADPEVRHRRPVAGLEKLGRNRRPCHKAGGMTMRGANRPLLALVSGACAADWIANVPAGALRTRRPAPAHRGGRSSQLPDRFTPRLQTIP